MRIALKQDKPFACLVPSDLVDRICVGPDGNVLQDVREAVDKTDKIAFLAPNLTWIIHNINIQGTTYKQVYVQNRVTPEIELDVLMQQLRHKDLTPPILTCQTRDDWIRAQERHSTAAAYAHDPKVNSVQDGLVVYQQEPGGIQRTVVPIPLQKPLVVWKHHQMCHMSAGKINNILKKTFYFKGMYTLCRDVVADGFIAPCATCSKHV